MTRVKLIQELKTFCEDAIKNISLPETVQKGDTKEKSRVPAVYLMRLPDSNSAKKLAPYIIVQFIDSSTIGARTAILIPNTRRRCALSSACTRRTSRTAL